MKTLTNSEAEQVKQIALETAKRLKIPYISIDIGQLENGDWIVIEVGDPQFLGISQIPILELWNNLKNLVN